MKRIRIIGLCLVAVFAFSALVATAAQAAAPQWGQCVKQAKPKYEYENSTCTIHSHKSKEKKGVITETPEKKGSYELVLGVPETCVKQAKAKFEYENSTCTIHSHKSKEKKGVITETPEKKGFYEKMCAVNCADITSSSGASTFYTYTPEKEENAEEEEVNNGKGNVLTGEGDVVECATSEGEGKIVAPEEIAQTIKFKGCTTESGSVKCTSGSEPAGTIFADVRSFLEEPETEGVIGGANIIITNGASGPTASFVCGASKPIVWYEGSGPLGEVTPGTSVARFEVPNPAEGVQKIGGMYGIGGEIFLEVGHTEDLYGGASQIYHAGNGGWQTEQTIKGTAGLEVVG